MQQFYKHTKKDKHGRRKTFAGIFENNKLQIGVAQCNAQDQFCKATGRKIAIGRAKTNPITSIEVKYEERAKDAFHVGCEVLLNIK